MCCTTILQHLRFGRRLHVQLYIAVLQRRNRSNKSDCPTKTSTEEKAAANAFWKSKPEKDSIYQLMSEVQEYMG